MGPSTSDPVNTILRGKLSLLRPSTPLMHEQEDDMGLGLVDGGFARVPQCKRTIFVIDYVYSNNILASVYPRRRVLAERQQHVPCGIHSGERRS